MINKFRKYLLGIYVLSFLVAIQSCKNEDKENKDQPEVKAETKMENTPAPFTSGPFTVLKLDKNDLVYLFSAGQTKKLTIEFRDENTSTSKMTAIAYATQQNGSIVNSLMPKVINQSGTESWDTTGIKILGNNELSEAKVKKILKITGQITLGNAKDLYFYPKKDSNNNIFFIISTTQVAFTATGVGILITYPLDGEDSKPSPPAPPCNPCN